MAAADYIPVGTILPVVRQPLTAASHPFRRVTMSLRVFWSRSGTCNELRVLSLHASTSAPTVRLSNYKSFTIYLPLLV